MRKLQHQKTYGHTLAFINQKGGVGKSTLTTLLANIFYFQFKMSVTIIDADNPQYSIYKRRKKMEHVIKITPRLNSLYQKSYMSENSRAPINVLTANDHNFKTILEAARQESDLVLIDVAGTINQKSIIDILGSIEYFFIPVFQGSDTLNSSLEFYDNLMQFIVPHSQLFKSCLFFFNRVPYMNRLKKVKLKLKTRPCLDTFLYSYTVYENSFRNTLFPITDNNSVNKKPFNNLLKLATEVITTVYEYSSDNTISETPTRLTTGVDMLSNLKPELKATTI